MADHEHTYLPYRHQGSLAFRRVALADLTPTDQAILEKLETVVLTDPDQVAQLTRDLTQYLDSVTEH